MSEFTDKAKGLADQVAGKVKQGLGDVTGSDRLKTEGAAQEAKGHAEKAVGDTKGAAKDVANKASDAADHILNR